MSNWAALQEQLMGKPVAKRARHGIHFQNNDGSITANFSGKPCHFQDTDGLWKPIDTKLLPLGDGYYGCPHSKVKVHPAGTVAVAGTNYVQYTQLPSGQTGLVDNDKLVRKFSFGEQRMWVTEDGFRSEIQLNRIPTLTEARKLIASESGTLSKEYLKSLTTATDANGSVHTYSTLSAFRTWLAQAQFPVVIDPDFYPSDSGSYGDNALHSVNNKNYGAALVTISYNSKYIARWDLTSVNSSAVIASGSFKFTKANTVGAANAKTQSIYSISEANTSWIPGTANGNEQTGSSCWGYRVFNTDTWAGSAGLSTSGTDYETDLLASFSCNRADDQYTQYTGDLTTAGKSRVAGWFGANNTNYGIVMPCYEQITFHTVNISTESYRPVLTVTYTAGASGNPHYYYAQQ